MSEQKPKTVTVEAFANVHSHIRDGKMKERYIEVLMEAQCDVILPMPNTTVPLTTADLVYEYIRHADEFVSTFREGFGMTHLPPVTFVPTVMVTEQTTIGALKKCMDLGIRNAKIYPLNRTTNSHNGVRDYTNLIPLIKFGGEIGVTFHMHPEYPLMDISGRDAEYMFISIADMFLNKTNARLVWEHGTDSRCIPIWKKMAETRRFFVTITGHHLATNDDDTFGDVRATCKPQIKTELDRQGLVGLVKENHSWVMAGPDDAPHPSSSKHVHEGKCACGAYTAPFLHELYAHALDDLLQTDEGVETYINFTSRNARRIHNLPGSSRKVVLVRESFPIPLTYFEDKEQVEPFWAGENLIWSIRP